MEKEKKKRQERGWEEKNSKAIQKTHQKPFRDVALLFPLLFGSFPSFQSLSLFLSFSFFLSLPPSLFFFSLPSCPPQFPEDEAAAAQAALTAYKANGGKQSDEAVVAQAAQGYKESMSSSGGSSIGPLAGGAAGGALLLILLAVIVVRRRRRQRRPEKKQKVFQPLHINNPGLAMTYRRDQPPTFEPSRQPARQPPITNTWTKLDDDAYVDPGVEGYHGFGNHAPSEGYENPMAEVEASYEYQVPPGISNQAPSAPGSYLVPISGSDTTYAAYVNPDAGPASYHVPLDGTQQTYEEAPVLAARQTQPYSGALTRPVEPYATSPITSSASSPSGPPHLYQLMQPGTHNIYERTEDYEKIEPWFQPEMTRDAAENHLRGQPSGAFIIRSSTKANCHAITIRLPNGARNVVWNGLIERNSATGRFALKETTIEASSLALLVVEMENHPEELRKLGLPALLTQANTDV